MGTSRAHLIVGGFPPGATAAHDMDYARRRLLDLLGETPGVQTTVSNDFADIERWLPGCTFLVSYVAGPHLVGDQNDGVQEWLAAGGRWLGLHGTSGGRTGRIEGQPNARRMLKLPHHDTLGSFFLNHPPIRRFQVDVANPKHPLARGLPASFEVSDELYFIELLDRENSHLLLTTQLPEDPAPEFGFTYDEDTSLLPDNKTRALAYTRDVGRGGVAYIALGHCHSPETNGQPFVDESVAPEGKTPLLFRGSWETDAFQRLLRNALAWGAGA
ncbi:MAG: ThuA domain-containing protein [Deltaproteobacteria bacterium]|nr:ThuA domain-containing protein [Deltaproteobacteria bacterium]MBW2393299.1 ThuA domain-containing protein [Deltaproteobacteria bacterium]